MTDPTDQQLLKQFLGGDQSSALEQLFKRHGPLVKGVCLRVLENDHDADDALQAVFLVFARQSASIRNQQDLRSWFYGVALRCARQLKRKLAIRRKRETELQEEIMNAPSGPDAAWEDIRPVLDEELWGLSEKYRAPLIHCYLDGLSYEDAALKMGLGFEALKMRLARGRDLLRQRLVRRGMAVSSVTLGALILQNASSSVYALSDVAVQSTVQAVMASGILAGAATTSATGTVSATSIEVMKGVLQAMFYKKILVAATALAIGGGLTATTLPVLQSHFQQMAQAPASPPSVPPKPVIEKPAEEYLTGGPLAGLKLPVSKQNTGPGPEVELYPGSVEHWRADYMKYTPTRSWFDQQSLLKNWTAPEIPGVPPGQSEQYASPVYRQPKNGLAQNTGKQLPAVPVIRCKVNRPVFKLDLGELDIGMYVVRVIGAVETAKLRPFREPLYLRMQVNDGLKGETSHYRIRTGYVDEFYCVGYLYFHAPEKRRYLAELAVDQGTTVDLLVHSITLDDVLAGAVKRAIKKKRTLISDEEIEQLKANVTEIIKNASAQHPPLSPEERLKRDEAIWKWLPPLNTPAHYFGYGGFMGGEYGVVGKTMAQVETEFGKWEPVGNRETRNRDDLGVLSRNPDLQNAFLENKKLGLKYTMEDLWARKPLPDPYPFKDDGAGLYFPDPKDPQKGRSLIPIAFEAGYRFWAMTEPATRASKVWLQTGNRELAWDGAVTLIRHAYQFPSIDAGNFLSCVVTQPNRFGSDAYCRLRMEKAYWMSHYQSYLCALQDYDRLFEFIQGNEALAKSIRRFVPWVKTSEDLIKLLDVYLVQMTAKRILRYHDYTIPTAITDAAIVLADPAVTAPWMDWQFSRTHIYPKRTAGIQDLMISGCDREGCEYIGSTSYAQGQGGIRSAEPVERYVEAGGDTKFSLSDQSLYPKPLAQCYWQLGITIGGADFPRIGDVVGPDKVPFTTLREGLPTAARCGWKWSADPQFAWIIKNIVGRKRETNEEWVKIEAAAAPVKRAPWLDLKSRHLDNWFGALETGLEHDDYRFRRAAYVRTGSGWGHNHADALDLQLVAHGMPMTVDGGQRSGYSKPNDKFSRTHNVVEVDGGLGGGFSEYGLLAYGWLTGLSDAPGARYLQATAKPPPNVSVFRRQVALLDVDEGTGDEPLAIEQQKPRSKLKGGVTTPNSYLFDVFRVSGGSWHTYGFHGPVNDDFQWNATGVKPVGEAKYTVKITDDANREANYLSIFATPESKQAGVAPDTLVATWRYSRDGKMGSEQQMLGANFEAGAPSKFTRLTLLNAGGLRAMKADVTTTSESPVKYRFTHLMAQRQGAESAFAALIEPYAGEPFITSQKLLAISKNETDALRAVAVEVQTKNGHQDVCFADGRPERIREFQVQSSKFQISGEFAYHSTDKEGLRTAALTGGTLLQTPEVRLALPQRERTGKITRVDYFNKTFWIDQPWPAACAGEVLEIVEPGCRSSYTIASVTPEDKGSRIVLTRGADFYRSSIHEVVSDKNEVAGGIGLPEGRGNVKGMTVSNDTLSKCWRLQKSEGPNFTVEGSISEADFAPSNVVRLWEYGIGDQVRLVSRAGVRRLGANLYEVHSDSDLTVALKGSKMEISADQKTWKPVAGRADGAFFEGKLSAGEWKGSLLYLRMPR